MWWIHGEFRFSDNIFGTCYTYYVRVMLGSNPGQARIEYNMLDTRNCKINPDMCRLGPRYDLGKNI